MPGAQRDAERTRATVLDAAAAAIVERGPSVSLDLIAKRAGVSKGGLLHHFPSRDDLIAALMQRQREQFKRRLDEALDSEPEGSAGRFTRAYVRAVFADVRNSDRARERWTLFGMVGASPDASRYLREDDAARRERLEQDGIDPLRAEVIVNAANGTTATLLWSSMPQDQHERICDALLALANDAGPLTEESGPKTTASPRQRSRSRKTLTRPVPPREPGTRA